MRTAWVTVAMLLVLSAGVLRSHFDPGASLVGTWGNGLLGGHPKQMRLEVGAHFGATACMFAAATGLLFVWLGHLELALTAMLPVALCWTATLGLLRGFDMEVNRSDLSLLLICLIPATTQSLLLLNGHLMRYRGHEPSPRWTDFKLLLPLVLVVVVAALSHLAFKDALTSNFLRFCILIPLLGYILAVDNIVSPVAYFLMPSKRKRSAVAFSMPGAMRVHSLYRYLDIPAEQYVVWKVRLDPIFAHLDAAVPSSGRIFDAGCGYGIMSNLLAMRSASRTVFGFDQDERKLRVARRAARTLCNVHYLSADLIDAGYPVSDCVLLIDVLHYWSAEKQRRIIAGCAGCLRPAGTLIFREGMRNASAGHRAVDWAERAAVWLGHNPRGDGLCFQPREFYLREFAMHGLELQSEPQGWGRGSNAVLIFSATSGATVIA